jgi:iron complex outermembrane receptor protein
MRLLSIILSILFSCGLVKGASLTGTITDKATGEALIGASVYLPDLKTGAVTDLDGKYKITNLPASKITVQVTAVGYKTIAQVIDLKTTTTADFKMEEAIKEESEIVVTGNAGAIEKNKSPYAISLVSKEQLVQTASTNIIDAIANQPGISQVTTGSGISKPVIRGLGYNRVVVVNDGIRQEGQQWGDEHGIEIDEFAVDKVEILKGPASLAYGSDAMAGVINLISAPNVPDGKIQSSLLSEYQSNNGLYALSARNSGNIKGIHWDVILSDKAAHSYRNAYDGYVFNSGFKEQSASASIGTNRSWGSTNLKLSAYHFIPGIVEGNRDSATGRFTMPVNQSGSEGEIIAPENVLKSYKIQVPYQVINHYKAIWTTNYIMKKGALKSIIGWQQNDRQEFDNILAPNQYGLYFKLNTLNYDFRYELPEKHNTLVSFGIGGMAQNSQNLGTEFLVPGYSLFDIGAYGIARKTIKSWTLNAGLRIDTRSEQTESLYLDSADRKVSESTPGAETKFQAFHVFFPGFSGSAGATWQINKDLNMKINVSKGFRAPNIAELGANGVHEGTFRYEHGNPNLKPEQSVQLDYGLGFNSQHVTAEISLFGNYINQFIFFSKLNNSRGGDSLEDGYAVFQYTQGNALLYGGEAMIDIHPHPLDWLHFENTFSFVNTQQLNKPDSEKYLPFTPPAKITSELRANKKKLYKSWTDAWLSFGIDYYLAQNKIYSAFNTETATPGYLLLNAAAGTSYKSNGKTRLTFVLTANNLLDNAYQSHLSRLKYADYNYVTGRTGVYNMGRNIGVKVIIPF